MRWRLMRLGRMRLGVAVLTLAVLPWAAGCGESDDPEDYCAAVEEHQKELTEIAASGSLLDALDVYRDLEEEAPPDIADDWQQVVTRIEALDEALRAADVDPATYDSKNPPEGLSKQERDRIEAAATELRSPQTVRSMANVEQQALDVCKTPLSR